MAENLITRVLLSRSRKDEVGLSLDIIFVAFAGAVLMLEWPLFDGG